MRCRSADDKLSCNAYESADRFSAISPTTARIGEGITASAQGLADDAEGLIQFPTVTLQYLTGTTSRLGQINSWSKFGSRYEDNGFTMRAIEVVNHMVYGSLDLLTAHATYSIATSLGATDAEMKYYAPYFSPAPSDVRGVARDLGNLTLLMATPAAMRAVKVEFGIPEKPVPAYDSSVARELAAQQIDISERIVFQRAQGRWLELMDEMAEAAANPERFSRWAADGERGAIIMSKPKPIDWTRLKTLSPDAFLDAVKQRFAYVKTEVMRRVDAGQTAPEILEWYNTTVKPELKVLSTAINDVMSINQDAGRLLHNFRNRISNLTGLLPLFLEEDNLGEVRVLCSPPKSSLSAMIASKLATDFDPVADIRTTGLDGICFAPDVDLDAMMQILENFVTNAAQHRKDGQSVAQIKFKCTGTVLGVADEGKGMSPAQLERVNAGIRSHDGEAVVVNTAETQGHGFGIQTVHQLAADNGFQVAYASSEGEGTTAALLATEPGRFVPDAMTYIFTDDGSWDTLRNMVKGLSTDHRIELLRNLSKISVDIIDAFYSKYRDLAKSHQDRTPAVEIAQRLLKRYVPYLEVLVGDNPVVQQAPVTLICYRIADAIRGLVNPPEESPGHNPTPPM